MCNGKFWDIIGPYGGNGVHNDEWIFQHIYKNNINDFTSTFDESMFKSYCTFLKK